MMRAIIGTVSVLAGFAVLEQSVDASTGLAGSCKATQAFALLQANEALSVRATPTPEGTVIGTLATADMSREVSPSVVTVTGSQSGWARIALNTAQGYAADSAAPQSFGWVPADLLMVDARVDGTITAYDRPDLLGSALATIEGDDMKFRVLGFRGTKLQVVNARYGHVWIDKWCAREEGCRG